MDFIEAIFGIAPDGGLGALEFMPFVIPVIGVWYIVVRRRRQRR
jgi:hypothetical protein